jgi:hypothetical protein
VHPRTVVKEPALTETETGWLPVLSTVKVSLHRAWPCLRMGAESQQFQRNPANSIWQPACASCHASGLGQRSFALVSARHPRPYEHRAAVRDTFWTWREAMYRAANLITEDVYDVPCGFGDAFCQG